MKHDISYWRYQELKAVIMQYDDRIAKIRELLGQIPHGAAGVDKYTAGDPTGKKGQKIAQIRSVNEKIDRATAGLLQGDIQRKLLTYDDAIKAGYIGSRNLFFKHKRKMFDTLDNIL